MRAYKPTTRSFKIDAPQGAVLRLVGSWDGLMGCWRIALLSASRHFKRKERRRRRRARRPFGRGMKVPAGPRPCTREWRERALMAEFKANTRACPQAGLLPLRPVFLKARGNGQAENCAAGPDRRFGRSGGSMIGLATHLIYKTMAGCPWS